jgi:hypothetical protein
VVKPLARLGLVTVSVAARHAINIEVSHGNGPRPHAFALWRIRRE